MQVERKTSSAPCVPMARIPSTSSFQNRIYEICIRNASFSRQRERQMARQSALLAAEPTSIAESEFAFPYAFVCLLITTSPMELLVSNTL